MENTIPPIRAVYYESPDDNILLLYGPLNIKTSLLREVFLSLNHEPKRIRLDQLSFIKPLNGIEIELLNDVRANGLRFDSEDDCRSFRWAMKPNDWDDLAALIENMDDTTHRCHQQLEYMFGYVDDASVILSRGEYKDDEKSGFRSI